MIAVTRPASHFKVVTLKPTTTRASPTSTSKRTTVRGSKARSGSPVMLVADDRRAVDMSVCECPVFDAALMRNILSNRRVLGDIVYPLEGTRERLQFRTKDGKVASTLSL